MTDRELLEALHHLRGQNRTIIENQEKIMGDVSKLTAAVTKLSTDVDALLAAQGASDQAAIDAQTTAVTAVDAKVVAATPAPPTA